MIQPDAFLIFITDAGVMLDGSRSPGAAGDLQNHARR